MQLTVFALWLLPKWYQSAQKLPLYTHIRIVFSCFTLHWMLSAISVPWHSVSFPHSFIPQYIIWFTGFWLYLSEMDADCWVHSLSTGCVPLDGVGSFHVCQAYKCSWAVLLLMVWMWSSLGASGHWVIWADLLLSCISSTPFFMTFHKHWICGENTGSVWKRQGRCSNTLLWTSDLDVT